MLSIAHTYFGGIPSGLLQESRVSRGADPDPNFEERSDPEPFFDNGRSCDRSEQLDSKSL